MRKKGKASLFKGAVILGIGTFSAKLLGAIYRIPLTNLIGGYGLGIYQTVFPVYTILLDFAGAGVPSALSKIISSYNGENKEFNAYNYLKSSIKLFLILGIIASLVMALFSYPISKLQGNTKAFLPYVFLSPAVLIVSVICCFRGYFQGLMNMKPTALSQITEQAVKLIFGIFFCNLFLPNIEYAVTGTVFAITLSEAFALLLLIFLYLKRKKKYGLNFYFNKSAFKVLSKTVVKYAIPVTFTGILIPLSGFIDSFIIINIISKYSSNATSLYGILSGVVSTVINLPVSLCYAIATVSIPIVSSAKSEQEKNVAIKKSLLLTLIFSLLSAIVCFLFSGKIIGLLFKSLSVAENDIAVKLLSISSSNVLFLSLLQTGNAILIGKGKPYYPLISMGIAIVVKTVLEILLLNIPSINIYGGAISQIACYFLASLINFIMLFYKGKKKVQYGSKTAYACRRQTE